MKKSKAANLIALRLSGSERNVDEGNVGHAKHAELLIRVTQVRDLELLRLVLERGQAAGSKEAQRGFQLMALIASGDPIGRRSFDVDVAPARL